MSLSFAKIDGIVSMLIKTVKCHANETLFGQISSSPIEFDGSVGKLYIRPPRETVASMFVQMKIGSAVFRKGRKPPIKNFRRCSGYTEPIQIGGIGRSGDRAERNRADKYEAVWNSFVSHFRDVCVFALPAYFHSPPMRLKMAVVV